MDCQKEKGGDYERRIRERSREKPDEWLYGMLFSIIDTSWLLI